MKRLTIIAMLLSIFSGLSLNAQTAKGSFALGLHNFAPVSVFSDPGFLAPTNALGIAFGTARAGDSDDETKFTIIGLSGDAQYFVIDNLGLGVLVNFNNQKITADGSDESVTTTIFMGGPQAHYYIPLSTKMKLALGGSAAFGSAKSKFGDEESDPVKLTRFGGGASLNIFPTEHFSLDIGAAYDLFTAKADGASDDEKEKYSNVVLNVGFTVYLH